MADEKSVKNNHASAPTMCTDYESNNSDDDSINMAKKKVEDNDKLHLPKAVSPQESSESLTNNSFPPECWCNVPRVFNPVCVTGIPVCVPTIFQAQEVKLTCENKQSRKEIVTKIYEKKYCQTSDEKIQQEIPPVTSELNDENEKKVLSNEDLQEKPKLNLSKDVLDKIHNVPQKIDIYYFDHGNSGYFRTTDVAPVLKTQKYCEIVDYTATRFWAEFFNSLNFAVSFITAFILQLLKFLLSSIIRTLIVGVIQLISDYLIKPLLSIIFNGIIQPFLIFFYNIATSFRDLCEPIAEIFGFFFKQFANILRQIRFVEVYQNNKNFSRT